MLVIPHSEELHACRQLLALHRTTVLRHDEYGQETVLNLLLRNYLHYSLYDQVIPYTILADCRRLSFGKGRTINSPQLKFSGA